MAVDFRHQYQAQWADMDFNQHMANSAILDYAGNTRMLFTDAHGFSANAFAELQIGPVILEDKLRYSREIRLLESFVVDLQMVATTPDARRFKLRNRFVTGDDVLCATVDSVGLWFNLAERRPITPPDALREVWLSVARADDFEMWE